MILLVVLSKLAIAISCEPLTISWKPVLFPLQSATDLFDRGCKKLDASDLDGAIADFTKAIELNPKFSEAYSNRGIAKMNRRELDGAIGDYSKAIELNPKYADAYNNRGNAKIEKKDFEGAIADYSKAIELNRKYANAFFNRGNAKREKEDFDGAIGDYSKAIELNPRDADAYNNRGNAKFDKKDFDGAIADYSKVIELNPKNAGAYNIRGNARKSIQDWPGAEKDFTKAIELEPTSPSGYHFRGCLRYNIRLWKDALKDFRKAYEVDPSFQDYPRLWIWLTRARLGEGEAATKELADYLITRKGEDWEGKLLRYVARSLSEEDLLRAAKDKDEPLALSQESEALFFIASRHLVEGDKDGARLRFKGYFQKAKPGSIQYDAAIVELKLLESESKSEKK